MDIAKMSSSANQPVCVGSSCERSDSRSHMNASPAEPSRYFTVPPVTKSTPSVRDVQLERADRLVAVGEHERAGAWPSSAIAARRCGDPMRKETAVQQTSAVRSSIASAKRSSGMRTVGLAA